MFARTGSARRSRHGWPAGSRSTPTKSGCPNPRYPSRRAATARLEAGHRRDCRRECTGPLRAIDPPRGRRVPGDRRVHRGRLPGRRTRARRRDPRSFRPAGRRAGAARPPAKRPPRVSAASRSTSCRWRPGRSTHTPSTKPIWPAAGSPSCRSPWLAAWHGPSCSASGRIYRVVHEILHPQVDRQQIVPSDTYWAALRKIHRMRKPVFMGSLWLRARFDVEYLGLPLPTAPPGIARASR